MKICFRYSLPLVFSALIFFQGTASLAAKKDLSYGNFTKVRFIKNYDGDTITVDLKGQHPLFGDDIPVRVAGIDTPEIRGKCAQEKALAREAKGVVEKVLKKARRITLKNVQRGKYFRILADVQADKQNLADILIEKGLAVRYDGGTKGFDWCSRKAKRMREAGGKGGPTWEHFLDKILH
ncbi:MAG: thermonuclease family protein [Candidatus Electrothrix sp. EH2]|nr:thermonuclease family protein [Candidatus Electrothrix sp. EH2]